GPAPGSGAGVPQRSQAKQGGEGIAGPVGLFRSGGEFFFCQAKENLPGPFAFAGAARHAPSCVHRHAVPRGITLAGPARCWLGLQGRGAALVVAGVETPVAVPRGTKTPWSKAPLPKQRTRGSMELRPAARGSGGGPPSGFQGKTMRPYASIVSGPWSKPLPNQRSWVPQGARRLLWSGSTGGTPW